MEKKKNPFLVYRYENRIKLDSRSISITNTYAEQYVLTSTDVRTDALYIWHHEHMRNTNNAPAYPPHHRDNVSARLIIRLLRSRIHKHVRYQWYLLS